MFHSIISDLFSHNRSIIDTMGSCNCFAFLIITEVFTKTIESKLSPQMLLLATTMISGDVETYEQDGFLFFVFFI